MHIAKPELTMKAPEVKEQEARSAPQSITEEDTIELTEAPKPLGLANSKLVRAEDMVPGRFLSPPEYDYHPDSEFNQSMGRKALEIAQDRSLENPTKSIIEKRLQDIANLRRELALKADPDNVYYGKPIEEQKKGNHMYDSVNPRIKCRHKAYLSKVKEWWDAPRHEHQFPELGEVSINGKSITLSIIAGDPNAYLYADEDERADCFVINHPEIDETVLIKNFAYEQLTEAFSTEPWDLNKIASNYRLLCNGTPWMQGTPSIIETFLDGMFRSKGWALPEKISEPFWSAILHNEEKDGPYQWKHFIQNFKGGSEP